MQQGKHKVKKSTIEDNKDKVINIKDYRISKRLAEKGIIVKKDTNDKIRLIMRMQPKKSVADGNN